MAKVKRLPVDTERFLEEAKIPPLFLRASGINTIEDEKIEKAPKQHRMVSVKEPKPKKQKQKHVSNDDLKLCVFRLRADQIRALGLINLEDKAANISKTVREALEMYLSEFLEKKIQVLHLPVNSAKTPENTYESQGIRLNKELIDAIRVVSATNSVLFSSEIVRNAIDEYLKLKDAN
jgi:hypothetical protein